MATTTTKNDTEGPFHVQCSSLSMLFQKKLMLHLKMGFSLSASPKPTLPKPKKSKCADSNCPSLHGIPFCRFRFYGIGNVFSGKLFS